jgi:hypothetical protein
MSLSESVGILITTVATDQSDHYTLDTRAHATAAGHPCCHSSRIGSLGFIYLSEPAELPADTSCHVPPSSRCQT